MTETRHLLEAAILVESGDTGPWRVRLISEGKGSSGIYPASLLEGYGHAFNDSLSFENHPVGWDGPQSRNFTQIVGKVVGETWIEKDERGKVGVYANWDPDPDHRERLARYKKNLGLSIYIEGDGHLDEDGEFVVDSFNPMDPYKSVDVVIAAGRGGRFEENLKEIYSQRSENKPSAETSAQEGKDKMDTEKIVEALEALTAKVAALESASNAKAEENAQREADENAATEAREQYAASVEAIEAVRADLLPSQVKHLMAEAKAGKDVTPLIESSKALVAEMREDAKLAPRVQEGRVVRGSENTSKTYGVWSK